MIEIQNFRQSHKLSNPATSHQHPTTKNPSQPSLNQKNNYLCTLINKKGRVPTI